MQQLGSAARSVRSLRLEGYCEITRSESLKTGGKAVAFNGRLLQDRPGVGTGADRRAEKQRGKSGP